MALLRAGYFSTYTIGFKRDGSWVPPTAAINGYLVGKHVYSSGRRALNRSSVRSY